jgi:galactokinase
VVRAPGRVNLIGEHIDYHGLPVLPMALRRGVQVEFRARADRRIRAVSGGYGEREFEWTGHLKPVAPGDWENYLRAAALIAWKFCGDPIGIDVEISSDLPAAAGLSSSSALIVAFTLGLLRANGYNPGFEDLMQVLPEGEQFVGTRGGGMDHAASLGSREGCASLVSFAPGTAVRHVPIPRDWGFWIADSGVRAEKSGAAREKYNARRRGGAAALARLGLETYTEARVEDAARLDVAEERDAFLHTVTERERVRAAVAAMECGDIASFGAAMVESHQSLRDRLHVSCAELDALVERAMAAGAAGARLTGAGFGGCVVICGERERAPALRAAVAGLMDAEAGDGALEYAGSKAGMAGLEACATGAETE